MCSGSNLTAELYYNNIPLICGTKEFASKNIIPGGSRKNLDFLNGKIWFSDSIQKFEKLILADAQTSGGLLISSNKAESKEMLNELNQETQFTSKIIGEFKAKKEHNIYCRK